MQQTKMDEWVTLKTSNYNEIFRICQLTLEFSLFYCIIGSPGAGKTTAFKNFTEQFANVFYLRLDANWRPKDLYVKILRLCGIQDYGYDLASLHLAEKVGRVLNEKPEKSMIVIDDAGRFRSSEYVENFQALRDMTQEKVGIICSGTQKWKKDFDSWLARSHNGIPELSDRILDWVHLKTPSRSELKSIAAKNGVAAPEVLDRITKKCTSFRALKNEIIKLRLKEPGRLVDVNSADSAKNQDQVQTA